SRTLVFLHGLGENHLTFSPAHLCRVVSCRYFRTDLATLYRTMLFPAAGVLVLAWIRFLVCK
ncbi:MAG TPA: DUF401 family protein, partial [Atribacteraceae bacterium]|nr:DUF401 family protein [Atribacteraceae bacterium]